MKTLCFIWCTICGGVLDRNDQAGKLRSHIRLKDFGNLAVPGDCEGNHTYAGSDGVSRYAYNSKVLPRKDVEWLLHFKMFGAVHDPSSTLPQWSHKPKNESIVPGLFLSEEADIEDRQFGEVFWVPGTSSNNPDSPANDLSDIARCYVNKGWILLYDRNSPGHRFAAHTHCLQLFDKFSEQQRQSGHDTSNMPLTLSELARSLKLRRIFIQDSGFSCVYNRTQRYMTMWQHSFFGAQCFGWGPTRWECFAGDEVYCANPIEVSHVCEFARAHKLVKRRDNKEKLSMSASVTPLFQLPPELLHAVLLLLPLQSIRNLRTTCRTTRSLIGEGTYLWRTKTIGMHGDWCWELADTTIFPYYGTNWMQVLWQIELARQEVVEKAGNMTPKFRWRQMISRKRCCDSIYRPMMLDKKGFRKLPLGLKNRLRIWCCLESIGKDGTQTALQGQKNGLDPQIVEWDGTSTIVDCPSCGRSNAVSFSRLEAMAERTDLS